jgi:hypothetical protein
MEGGKRWTAQAPSYEEVTALGATASAASLDRPGSASIHSIQLR